MAVGLAQGGVLEVDLIPDTTFEELQTQIRAELRDSPRKTVGSIVDRYLPDRLTTPFLAMAGVEAQTRGAHLSAKALNQLVNRLKGWPLGGVRSVPLERGEVVCGRHLPRRSRIRRPWLRASCRGLLLCGEILDIAGPVGGYNLQAAWSTGFVAGEAAVGNILTKRP